MPEKLRVQLDRPVEIRLGSGELPLDRPRPAPVRKPPGNLGSHFHSLVQVSLGPGGVAPAQGQVTQPQEGRGIARITVQSSQEGTLGGIEPAGPQLQLPQGRKSIGASGIDLQKFLQQTLFLPGLLACPRDQGQREEGIALPGMILQNLLEERLGTLEITRSEIEMSQENLRLRRLGICQLGRLKGVDRLPGIPQHHCEADRLVGSFYRIDRLLRFFRQLLGHLGDRRFHLGGSSAGKGKQQGPYKKKRYGTSHREGV